MVTMYQAAYVDRAWTSGQGWQRGQAPLKYAEGIINDGNFELLTDFVFLLCTEGRSQGQALDQGCTLAAPLAVPACMPTSSQAW